MNDSDLSERSERPLYLYILVLGNLIAVIGVTFLMLGILGALGLISAITDSLGGFGSSFASATTGSAILYSYAFLASLVSLAASLKMFRERPQLWLLALVTVLQVAAAAAFHSGVSVLVAIPLVAAIYGFVMLSTSTPASGLWGRTSHAPAAPAYARPQTPAASPAPQRAAEVKPPLPVATPPAGSELGATVVAGPPKGTDPVVAAAANSQETVVHRPAVGVAERGPAEQRAGERRPDAQRPGAQRPAEQPAAERGAVERRTCADCGAVNLPGARFCRSCGSILPGSS